MGSRARRLDDERVFGGSQCTLRITCRRFDSGSFIELTVITRPRLVSAPVVWLKYEVDLRALFMENALGEKAGDVSITRVEGRELGLAPWNRPSPKELWGRSPNEAAVKVSR